MIKQEEAIQLRIGNTVTYHSDEGDMECVLDSVDIMNISMGKMGNNEAHSFISISDEILLRCKGFHQKESGNLTGSWTESFMYFSTTKLSGEKIINKISLTKSGHIFLNDVWLVRFYYLHELQNLVFALTGKEIVLKK